MSSAVLQIRSKFFLAALFFALVNLCLVRLDFSTHHGEIDKSSKHTWAYWLSKDYAEQKPQPNVVLIGSSLLMNSVWCNEAQYTQRDVDIVTNRRVTYLDSVLTRLNPGYPQVSFSMALPGSMLSDDYMVARTLLSAPDESKVVVLGLSPRDFVDSDFRSPASSEHFKYFAKNTNIDDLVELAMPQWWQRVPYYAQKIVLGENAKADINQAICSTVGGVFDATFGLPKIANVTRVEARNAIYETEISQGLWLAHPNTPQLYHDTDLDKLKAKFGRTNAACLKNQRDWLEQLLSLCEKNKYQVVIANMPITQLNISLFPPGVYEQSIKLMADGAAVHKYPFVNLQTDKFSQSDFTDVCHMGATGGKKFLDEIAPFVVAAQRQQGYLVEDGLAAHHASSTETHTQ